MGCQCAHQNEENDNEILKKKDNSEEPENLENNNNGLEQKDEIFGLTNQEGNVRTIIILKFMIIMKIMILVKNMKKNIMSK